MDTKYKGKGFQHLHLLLLFSHLFHHHVSQAARNGNTRGSNSRRCSHCIQKKKNYKRVRLRGLDSRGIDSDDAVPLQFRLMGKYGFEAFSQGRRTFLPFFRFSEMLRSGHTADKSLRNEREILLAAEILTRILSLLPAVTSLRAAWWREQTDK